MVTRTLSTVLEQQTGKMVVALEAVVDLGALHAAGLAAPEKILNLYRRRARRGTPSLGFIGLL